jgi:fatty-acyl-CoA synthase
MAWGLPYAAVMAGADLVLPGPGMAPNQLLDLLESERVTLTAGVPTIWMGMLPLLEGRDLSALRQIVCGGSAVPKALSEGWRAAIGLPITQAWGMTELSPLGTVCSLRSELAEASEEAKADIRATAGIPPAGVELRIVDPDTRAELPWDNQAVGELEARGPWIARQYYRTDEPGPQFSDDGWLRTGDVAAISELGYLRLVDRTKDLIKSGGEWINPAEIEALVGALPEVALAAVIGRPDRKWGERPVLVVETRAAVAIDDDALLAPLRGSVPSWWIPDDVVRVPRMPLSATGKIDKIALRRLHGAGA